MNRWVKRLLVAVPVLVALGYGAIFVYTQWINDPEDEFTVDDARELAAATSPTSADPATTAAQEPSASSEPVGAEPSSGDNVDGVWLVAAGSEFGYRVDEALAGVNATARSRERHHRVDHDRRHVRHRRQLHGAGCDDRVRQREARRSIPRQGHGNRAVPGGDVHADRAHRVAGEPRR